MKHYESAYLGLILAGVLMMAVGLGLMMSPVRSPEAARTTFAERQALANAPSNTARSGSERGTTPPAIQ